MIDLYNDDCLKVLPTLKENSVDLILTDPPYGTTACSWDSIIPLEDMWREIKRVAKKDAPIILFGSEPFSTELRHSNIKHFKFDWIWNKKKGANFLNSRFSPQKVHEIASVFCYGSLDLYRDQLMISVKPQKSTKTRSKVDTLRSTPDMKFSSGYPMPKSILNFSRDQNTIHPTQKPVALLQYLIALHSLPKSTVLDFTMGSGSTGIAAKTLDRKFIGIEMDPKYFKKAQYRIENFKMEEK